MTTSEDSQELIESVKSTDQNVMEELNIQSNIREDGFHYFDENGEEKILPRCKEQDSECYKYDEHTLAYKEYLQKELFNKYPDICPGMIEIYVDYYLNYKEDFEKACWAYHEKPKGLK